MTGGLMNMRAPEIVSSLDIWGIVQTEIEQIADYAVKVASLSLSNFDDEKSYLEIMYYDLNDHEQDKLLFDKIYLSNDDSDKMYSKIFDMVELPSQTKRLRIKLQKDKIPDVSVDVMPTYNEDYKWGSISGVR